MCGGSPDMVGFRCRRSASHQSAPGRCTWSLRREFADDAGERALDVAEQVAGFHL